MRPLIVLTLLFFALFTGIGIAHPKKAASDVPETPVWYRSLQPQPFQVGRASWYGKKFEGKKTASGETYNLFQLTAAHPTLPLGSIVKVTNLRNHKWVILRVNDRGPVPRSRIIDLSYAAAGLLGLRGHGVEKVKLDLLEPVQPEGTVLAYNEVAPGSSR
jgi:rare lipoprotein A (peptidoglycan hydrolase)